MVENGESCAPLNLLQVPGLDKFNAIFMESEVVDKTKR